MTLVLFILVNLVFFCPKMILCIKIEISRNDFYNSLGFHFHNTLPKRSINRNNNKFFLLRDLVEQVAESQQALSAELVQYDEQVESEVLLPLTKIIKENFTNCAKLKKQVKQVRKA